MRVDEKEKPELVDTIFTLRNTVNFNECRTAKPDKKVIELVEREMPNGSDIYSQVKNFVEQNMGITSARGFRYSCLVRIVAAALEPTYKAKMKLK